MKINLALRAGQRKREDYGERETGYWSYLEMVQVRMNKDQKCTLAMRLEITQDRTEILEERS